MVGLYLAPPERAIFLAVDENAQIPALDRTHLTLPLRLGQVESYTHDYERNGTLKPLARIHRTPGLIHHPGQTNRCPSERE